MSPASSVRLGIALLLFAAAVLKTHQLATEPLLGTGLVNSRPVLVAVVEYELLLAFWLLSGLAPGAAWWVTATTFVLFAVVAASKGVAGESSCGCFGRIATNPWLSFSIDVAAAAGLIRLGRPKLEHSAALAPRAVGDSPRASGLLGPRRFRAYVLAVWIVAAVPLGVLAARGPEREPLARIGHRVGDLVIVEPERMVGQQFDLARYIDIGERLLRDQWLVVLYQADCGKCRELLSRWDFAAGELHAPNSVAFVSVPPHRPSTHTPVAKAVPALHGRLLTTTEWFVPTPLLLHIQDARVVGVSSDNQPAFPAVSEMIEGRAAPSELICQDRREDGEDRAAATTHGAATDGGACGSSCLFLVCALSGRRRSLAWCRKTLEADSDGVSMLRLKNACQSLGFVVSADRGSYRALLQHLQDRGGRAILHVLPSHFVVAVNAHSPNRICIVDPARGVRVLNEADFARWYEWSGHMVLIVEPDKGGGES